MRTALFCPFTAGTVFWQAETGAWTLSACVRGTFRLVHGREAVLADTQEPVGDAVHHDGDASKSLRVPSDLVPYKPRVDVLLVGSAHAREPTDALVARLSVGSVDKSVGVVGDRVWMDGPDGPEPGDPRRFREMPLTAERAAKTRDNPHGFDLTGRPRRGALALPNLEVVDDGPEPGGTAGFGPLSAVARARRSRLSRAQAEWAHRSGRASGPAPAELDFLYFNAAPRDQQLDALKAGDLIVLENLSRERQRLETRIPSVRPRAFVVPSDVERGFEISLRIDTLWIDADRGLLTLSWRGLATVDTADEDAIGTLVVAAETRGREVGYAQIAKLLHVSDMGVADSETITQARAFVAASEPPPRGRPANRVEEISIIEAIPLSLDSDTVTQGRIMLSEDTGEAVDSDLMPTPGAFRPRRPLPGLRTDAPPESMTSSALELDPEDLEVDDPKTVTRTDTRARRR